MWQFITLYNPDLWIWLGDNIYGDTEDISVLKYKYDMQYNHHEYTKLRNKCPIIGTWDDHEISRIEIKDISYPVYEITSSGLTHSYKELKGELNPYR